jgi:branched-subunit amino acid transport protein AzlD
MSGPQALATIAILAACTLLTRALPFFVFSGKQGPPPIVLYLGRVLPYAIIGMLIVYCLRGAAPFQSPHALPEAAGVAVTAAIYWKWRQSLLAILGGTAVYMLILRIL